MAEYKVRINVKTDVGYDQLYPQSDSDIIKFNNANSDLESTNVEGALLELDASTSENKLSIGDLSGLQTNTKTSIVESINEIDNGYKTNKNNIGVLSNLKTKIKTNIVNAINNLYDLIIGKTVKNLNDINNIQEEGYYVDAIAIKELNQNLKNKKIPYILIVSVPINRSFAPGEATNEYYGTVPVVPGYRARRIGGTPNGDIVVCWPNGFMKNFMNTATAFISTVDWIWLMEPDSND